MKNQDVIDQILRYHPDMPNYQGCDGYKCGDPMAECTGVVSALVPTVEVIRKAIDLGANLIITHEPIFYNTPDEPRWPCAFPNQIAQEKLQLLEEHGITVWRDHDHIHMHQPDGIFTGVLKYLGWEDYYDPTQTEVPFFYPCRMPETTVGELRNYLIEKLGMNGLRYIGNPNDIVTNVALCAHLYPGGFSTDTEKDGYYTDYATLLIGQMEKNDGIQVLIPGEVIDWDVLSYIRDAVALGKTRACMNIGHFNLEELGMRYTADWLKELLGDQVPVTYVPTGDIYRYE